MQYKVKVKNRTVKVWDSQGNYGWAKCHPEDKFDIGVGFKIAVDRINPGFEIGDKFRFRSTSIKKYCNGMDSAMSYVFAMPNFVGVRFCYNVSPFEVNMLNTEYTVQYSFMNYKTGDNLYIIEDKNGRYFCFKNLIKEKHGDTVYGV